MSARFAPVELRVDTTPLSAPDRQALEKLPGQKALVVIPGATHLFEEPGTLEQVADLARRWFLRWLAAEALPSAAPPI